MKDIFLYHVTSIGCPQPWAGNHVWALLNDSRTDVDKPHLAATSRCKPVLKDWEGHIVKSWAARVGPMPTPAGPPPQTVADVTERDANLASAAQKPQQWSPDSVWGLSQGRKGRDVWSVLCLNNVVRWAHAVFLFSS